MANLFSKLYRSLRKPIALEVSDQLWETEMALLASHKALEDAKQAVAKYGKRRERLQAQLNAITASTGPVQVPIMTTGKYLD